MIFLSESCCILILGLFQVSVVYLILVVGKLIVVLLDQVLMFLIWLLFLVLLKVIVIWVMLVVVRLLKRWFLLLGCSVLIWVVCLVCVMKICVILMVEGVIGGVRVGLVRVIVCFW